MTTTSTNKTLVVILSETRAHELTFTNFKRNVLDELNADLCVCIGVRAGAGAGTGNIPSDPFYAAAKYRFTYLEPDDFATAFDEAYQFETSSVCPKQDNPPPLPWRKFLEIKDQIMGGVKDPHHQHAGSAGILIFFRWFLLKNLKEQNLLTQYDRFIITRSDYLYQLPHPQPRLLDPANLWIPNCEHYGGYTDRHVVLSKEHVEPYLNIFNNFVHRSHDYFRQMQLQRNWNLERLIHFHLEQNKVRHLVKEFPYIMYAVRNVNGTTRWGQGIFHPQLGYYIKYESEHNSACRYKKRFDVEHKTMDDFYRNCIGEINNNNSNNKEKNGRKRQRGLDR